MLLSSVADTLTRFNNLPTQTTQLVGRDQEMQELEQLLENPDIRLLTLLAPGGMGKTHLALELAHRQSPQYEDGCFFVALAPLSATESIIPAIADAIGLNLCIGIDPLDQIFDFLRPRNVLLVLDNYEHLLSGATLITSMLEVAPEVKFLVTSRQRLNLSCETVYTVEQLQLPASTAPDEVKKYGAVELFIQYARRLRPNWQPIDDDLTVIAHICYLAQGMPLAIILASAWINAMSLTDIAEEMSQDVDFLHVRFHDLPRRLQSIRAIFEDTWKQMTKDERQAYRRLSVFRGGCHRDALLHVTGADMVVIQQLINRGLLIYTDVGRYEIHELLRQYGNRMLKIDRAEYETVRLIHCEYYANHTLRMYDGSHVSDTRQWLVSIDRELDNLRHGWDWAIESINHTALWQYGKLYLYYHLRCRFTEGELMLARSVETLENTTPTDRSPILLARMLAFHVYLCHYAMVVDKMLVSYRKCQTVLRQIQPIGEDRETVAILYFLGSSIFPIYPEESQQLLEDCVEYCIQYQHQDALLVAARMNRLAIVKSLTTESDEIEEGLSYAVELNYLRGIAMFAQYRGMISYWIDNDVDVAHDWLNQSIQHHRLIGDPLNLAGALVTKADIALDSRQLSTAQSTLVEALTLFKTYGYLPWLLEPILLCVSRFLHTVAEQFGAAELCACVLFAPFLSEPRFHSVNLVHDPDPQRLWQSLKIALNAEQLDRATLQGKSHNAKTAIRLALASLTQVKSVVDTQLQTGVLDKINEKLAQPITQREYEVLQLICTGLSNSEIEKKLVITRNTVKTHISRLYAKLDVTSRAQAILSGQELGVM